MAAHTIVQCQPSGSSHSPRKFDRHTRSNMALNAHLVTEASDRAEMISSGICSPADQIDHTHIPAIHRIAKQQDFKGRGRCIFIDTTFGEIHIRI